MSIINYNLRYIVDTLMIPRYKFADIVGVSTSTVDSWLDEDSTPSIFSICSICSEFGISSDFLFGFSEIVFRPNSDPYMCNIPNVITIDDLPTDQRNAVHMMLRSFREANSKLSKFA